ncbi:MAG TPA: DUF2339 domain-containing protein [Acidobacteriaceae bacterium]|nr:DUF2339 domain-containing protein [Acidobacteriaceae bacterium]
MDPSNPANLEAELAELRARVRLLEQFFEQRGIVLGAQPGAGVPARPAATAAAPAAEPAVAVAPPQPMTAAPPVAARAPREDTSLESRIGSQWFNRIGILAVLIGVAWFLKLAFDNHWIGPLGRVLIGLVGGAALIAWSERFRSHGYTRFSYSLKAIGSGVLYLSLWAGFSLYHLFSSPVAFGAMILVTAFNGFLAWVQDAELLALYAIVGGLCTPALLSTGENHEVALFSYLLLLDLAVLVLVALRPWSRLLAGAFFGTVLYVSLWAVAYYRNDEFGTTAFFVACYFLIFALAPRLVRLRGGEDGTPTGWENLAVVVLPLLNAGLGFLAFYMMLEDSSSKGAEPWVAVAFAAFYLLLLRLPQRGSLNLLSALHLTITVVFLTIAIPLKASGRWLTIGWLVEGGTLVWVARRISSGLLRALAVLCTLLGIVALVTGNPSASLTPIFNERFGTYVVAIAVCAAIAWMAAKAPRLEEDRFAALPWPAIALAAGLAVNVLILLAFGWEIHSYWSNRELQTAHYVGGWTLLHEYRMYAQFTYSALFMAFGAALLAIGFWRRTALLRWQGLVLLAVAIAKVFTVDVSELSQGYRILSFLGLGALLLAVSFVYQRDWLHLRGAENKPI